MTEPTVEHLAKALLECSVEQLTGMANVLNNAILVKSKRQQSQIEKLMEQCSRTPPPPPPPPRM